MSVLGLSCRNGINKIFFRSFFHAGATKTQLRQFWIPSQILTPMDNLQKRMVTRSMTASSSPQNPLLAVSHNEKEKEFFIEIKNDENTNRNVKALLTYEWEDTDLVDLQHTYVPEEFRGKGVAKLLAKAAFDYFLSKDATMKLSCTYLQKYAKENKDQRYENNISWDSVCI